MGEILLGTAVLILPYLVGTIINVIEYGMSIEYYESIGWTYAVGFTVLVILGAFTTLAWLVGANVMAWLR